MTKKERNIQRHKMAVAIFRELTPEKQQEYIEDSKKRHQERFTKRKAEQKSKKEKLKNGRQYVVKNDVLLFCGAVGDYALSAGALLETKTPAKDGESAEIAYKVSYSICSPKDRPSLRTAKGYIGWRLSESKAHPYTFTIGLTKPGALIPERLAQLIRLHIEFDIVSKRVGMPAKLHRQSLNGCNCFLTPYQRSTPARLMRKVALARKADR